VCSGGLERITIDTVGAQTDQPSLGEPRDGVRGDASRREFGRRDARWRPRQDVQRF